MSHNLTFCSIICILSALIAAGCFDYSESNSEDPKAVAKEAYIFAYPMIQNYKTMYSQAVSLPPPEPELSFNQFCHKTSLTDPTFTDFVRPNNDTLYSTAWLDLQAEPMVLSVPPISDRYYTFQLVDMYTFNFGYIGTRETGTNAGSYMIAGPYWNGQKPAGIDAVFRSETRYVCCLGRTGVYGEADLQNAIDIQQQYRLQPLSAFLGESPSPSPMQEDAFPAYDPDKTASVDFIGYFNWLLNQVKIDPSEQAMIDDFSSIGIGPGLAFDSSSLDPGIRDAINAGVQSALQDIKTEPQNFAELVNGWRLTGRISGNREQMQGLYLTRAATAYYGIYCNNLEEAYYPSAFMDVSGEGLDGVQHDYVLLFTWDQIPKVIEHGFWSITIYNHPQQLLVANPIDRYSIGDRTEGLVYGPDGSLEIYLQSEDPGGAKRPNWLPAPNGPFSLTLRMYLPDPSALDPLYAPPGIEKTS